MSHSAHGWVDRSRPNELLFNSYDPSVRNQSIDYVHTIYSIDLRFVGAVPSAQSSVQDSPVFTIVGRWTIPLYQTDPGGDLELKGVVGIAYHHERILEEVPSHTFFLPFDRVLNSMFGGNTDEGVVKVTSVTALDNHYVSAQCLASGRILYWLRSSPFELEAVYLVDYLC